MATGLQIGGSSPTLPELNGIKSALGLDLSRKAAGQTVWSSNTAINSDVMGATNIAASGNFTLTITGSPVDFQIVQARVIAAGSNVLMTLGTGLRIPASSTLTSPITIAVGTKTLIGFQWDAMANCWVLVTAVPGYPLI